MVPPCVAAVHARLQVLKRTQKLLDCMHALSEQQLGLSDAAGASIMQRLSSHTGAKRSDVLAARMLLSAYLMQNSPGARHLPPAAHRARLASQVRAPATYAVGVPMPTAPYSQNIFYTAVGFLLGLVMTMCQLNPP